MALRSEFTDPHSLTLPLPSDAQTRRTRDTQDTDDTQDTPVLDRTAHTHAGGHLHAYSEHSPGALHNDTILGLADLKVARKVFASATNIHS